jgi:hypothetical protein
MATWREVFSPEKQDGWKMGRRRHSSKLRSKSCLSHLPALYRNTYRWIEPASRSQLGSNFLVPSFFLLCRFCAFSLHHLSCCVGAVPVVCNPRPGCHSMIRPPRVAAPATPCKHIHSSTLWHAVRRQNRIIHQGVISALSNQETSESAEASSPEVS